MQAFRVARKGILLVSIFSLLLALFGCAPTSQPPAEDPQTLAPAEDGALVSFHLYSFERSEQQSGALELIYHYGQEHLLLETSRDHYDMESFTARIPASEEFLSELLVLIERSGLENHSATSEIQEDPEANVFTVEIHHAPETIARYQIEKGEGLLEELLPFLENALHQNDLSAASLYNIFRSLEPAPAIVEHIGMRRSAMDYFGTYSFSYTNFYDEPIFSASYADPSGSYYADHAVMTEEDELALIELFLAAHFFYSPRVESSSSNGGLDETTSESTLSFRNGVDSWERDSRGFGAGPFTDQEKAQDFEEMLRDLTRKYSGNN